MKKLMFLLVLLLIGVFAITSCKKGEKKAAQVEEKSTEQKIKGKVEAKDLLLTEKEVQSFIKAYPVFVEICKKHGEKIEGLSDKKNLMSDMRILDQYGEYKEEIEGALKKYDFTFESFGATFGKIMGTLVFGETNKALGESSEGMRQMLDNPLIPKESKEDIKKNLKELEEYGKTEEGKTFKENWKIVEKYEGELKALFEK
jgi:hypothetical protein